MKKFLLAAIFFLTACSGNPHHAEMKTEENRPDFSSSHSFAEPPKEVLRAAQTVLDQMMHESDPPATDRLKGNDSMVKTGWVYGMSKDKWVEFDNNGAPQRKPLAVRRTYAITVTPALSGCDVSMDVNEELQEVNFKTGEPKGWKGVDTDPAVYDNLLRRLRDRIRAQ